MLDLDLDRRAATLNARHRHHAGINVLRAALADPELGRVALVSSFGAESVVLLHMLSVVAPATPVLFIDTQMLFPETLAYQAEIAARLPLSDIRVIRADTAELAAGDPDGSLFQRDTDACCNLRKVVPLERALAEFDAWITGRKRFQGGARAELEFFDAEPPHRLRVNPLAHWRAEDVRDYVDENGLPRHPLVARGYPSIGCAPCTAPVEPGGDPRSGRWKGSAKTECGIHFIGGKMVRGAAAPAQESEAEMAKPGAGALPRTPGYLTTEEGPLVVRDDGFHPVEGAPDLVLPPETDPASLSVHLGAGLIAIAFPAMTDGRGFTLARRLRALGYGGRLRATGRLIADQYAMARRVGFDEVEISADLARRQPEAQWLARADWQDWDHRERLAG